MAADNGRQVFAVPGRIDSPRSKGCHELIKNGAKLCEGAEDILCEFEYLFPANNRPSLLKESPNLPALSLSENETAVYDLVDKEEVAIDDHHPPQRLARLGGFGRAAGIGNEAVDPANAREGVCEESVTAKVP
jgi:predicted Rossmann fold nucleotide-binding protein DprA/Smf involved in DNA uptake